MNWQKAGRWKKYCARVERVGTWCAVLFNPPARRPALNGHSAATRKRTHLIASNSKFAISRAGIPVTLCLLGCVLAAICYVNWPRNTQAGQIIEGYGAFRSPHGNGLVTVNMVDSGHGTVTVSTNSSTRTPSSMMTFARARTWFGTWDEEDRFWTYIEGVGVHIHDEANGRSSTTHIDEFGDGSGVPPPFLRRLREAEHR